MDRRTEEIYDREAGAFAADWHAQPAPVDLHDTVRRFFRPGVTADIGCGSGRDTAWLAANGYDVTGYDTSAGLLAEARRRYPGLRFVHASLPTLAGVAEGACANVLCETVIMHLPPAAIAPSVRRLLAILSPGGTLYLTWRVTEGTDQRDAHGRLYAAFDPAVVRAAIDDAALLLDEDVTSASSGKRIHRIVARKAGAAA
jgi:SAM-dependent methyltransferase